MTNWVVSISLIAYKRFFGADSNSKKINIETTSHQSHRFDVDRSAIIRATQRISRDPELPAATKTMQRELEREPNPTTILNLI